MAERRVLRHHFLSLESFFALACASWLLCIIPGQDSIHSQDFLFHVDFSYWDTNVVFQTQQTLFLGPLASFEPRDPPLS